jgi:hypothetical protein
MNAPRRGYPLGALFVLVAAAAVLVAGIAPLFQQAVKGELASTGEFVASVVIGICCGVIVGAMLGMLQFHKGMGVVLGIFAGTAIGAVGGCLAMLPTRHLLAAAVPMVIGSGLVVGVALLMRRVNPS